MRRLGPDDLLAKGVEAVADGGVEHLVADADDDAAEDVGLDGRGELDLAAGLLGDAVADAATVSSSSSTAEVTWTGSSLLCSSQSRSYSRRMRKITGIRWFSSSSSRKLTKIGSAPSTALCSPSFFSWVAK